MKAIARSLILLLAVSGALRPQTPDAGLTPAANLTFEVASVRPSGHRSADEMPSGTSIAANGQMGGPGTSNPARIFYFDASLQRLLLNAFELQPEQLTGPDWLASEKFDIVANVRKGVTQQQADTMLQNLLIERFRLTFHRTTKEGPVYELTAAKGGPKLKPAVPGVRPGVQSSRDGAGLQRRVCRSCTMAELIRSVQGFDASRLAPDRIVDRTGLTGRYQFNLEYIGSAVNSLKLSAIQSQAHAGKDIFTALESELGLKLERGRAEVEQLVVDHAEKMPAAN